MISRESISIKGCEIGIKFIQILIRKSWNWNIPIFHKFLKRILCNIYEKIKTYDLIKDKNKTLERRVSSSSKFLHYICVNSEQKNRFLQAYKRLSPFLDRNFLSQLMFYDFEARYAEWLCGIQLLDWGKKLIRSTTPKGADFCFKENEKRFVIQVYAPEPKDVPSLDVENDTAVKVPDEAIQASYRKRIVDKISKNMKTLSDTDNPRKDKQVCYILTINNARSDFNEAGGVNKCKPPYFVKAFLGNGLESEFDSSGSQTNYKVRNYQLLNNKLPQHVYGLLLCTKTVTQIFSSDPDWIFFHNPNSKIKFDHSTFDKCLQFYVDESNYLQHRDLS